MTNISFLTSNSSPWDIFLIPLLKSWKVSGISGLSFFSIKLNYICSITSTHLSSSMIHTLAKSRNGTKVPWAKIHQISSVCCLRYVSSVQVFRMPLRPPAHCHDCRKLTRIRRKDSFHFLFLKSKIIHLKPLQVDSVHNTLYLTPLYWKYLLTSSLSLSQSALRKGFLQNCKFILIMNTGEMSRRFSLFKRSDGYISEYYVWKYLF